MVAIPVFRSRIAPVFNWCSTVLLFPEGTRDSSSGQKVVLNDAADCYERLRVLRQKGATTLVCGALTPDVLHYAENLKLEVICGVAGELHDVLKAYEEHKLDQPRFRLPGCRCRRRLSQTERRSTMQGGSGKGAGKGQGKGRGNAQGGPGRMGGGGGGPGGKCVCPHCGTTAPHDRGTPCSQLKCPQCGQQMTRQ